jgi:hypothetical protein
VLAPQPRLGQVLERSLAALGVIENEHQLAGQLERRLPGQERHQS